MSEQDKIDKLYAFVKKLRRPVLDPLLEELKPETVLEYQVYCRRTEAQWKEDYGKPGRDVYNYLKENGI